MIVIPLGKPYFNNLRGGNHSPQVKPILITMMVCFKFFFNELYFSCWNFALISFGNRNSRGNFHKKNNLNFGNNQWLDFTLNTFHVSYFAAFEKFSPYLFDYTQLGFSILWYTCLQAPASFSVLRRVTVEQFHTLYDISSRIGSKKNPFLLQSQNCSLPRTCHPQEINCNSQMLKRFPLAVADLCQLCLLGLSKVSSKVSLEAQILVHRVLPCTLD